MGGVSERRARELERAATAWLLEHDPLARSRREADRGPLVAWQMSPVEVPDVDDDQDDAGEIARTFADLSGGRLMPRFAAWTWILDDGCNMKRAEYMRATRAAKPERAAQWRAQERAPRAAAREADRARLAVADLFDGPHAVAEGRAAAGERRRAKDAARKRAARERKITESSATLDLLRRMG